MIFTGVVSLLSLVTLPQDQGGAAGANAAALVTTGASHVAVYNGTFLLGQSLMPCINALLLGSLMYRSRLVPRIIPVLGLIGADHSRNGRSRQCARLPRRHRLILENTARPTRARPLSPPGPNHRPHMITRVLSVLYRPCGGPLACLHRA